MTQQEVIKKFMASLDTSTLSGTAVLDEAIRNCSTFKSFKDLRNAMISDCKNAKSADDFLKTYCGIDLDNDDTGAITGSDAGGSTTKTNESIVPESGKLKNFKKSSFTVNGLTIKLGGGKKFSDLNASEKFIWQGLYTWWAKGALDLIAESYGDNFSFTDKSSATVKELEFNFYTSESGHAGAETGAHYTSNKADSLSMKVDMRFFGSSVNIGDPNGKSNISSAYLDRLLAHEFTHAVMFANIDYLTGNSLPKFITEGIPELTVGNTDANGMLEMAGNSTLLKKMLNSEAGTNSYAGGFMFLRYLARQAGDLFTINTSDALVQTFRGNDDIRNFAVNAKINAGAGADYIENYGAANVSIIGGAGNDSIMSQLNQSDRPDGCTLRGGDGNDSILSVGDKVSISGGAGKDFITNSGANVTIDSGDGNDTINNSGSNVSISSGAGNDSVHNENASNVKILGGSGNDDLGNRGGNKITLLGGAGNDILWNEPNDIGTDAQKVSMNGGAGSDTITNFGNCATLVGGDGNDIIRNYGNGYRNGEVVFSDVGKDVKIYGGAGKDFITNSGSNVTIDSGDDNDTISNTFGNNTSIIAGEGDDSIYNRSFYTTILGGDGKDSVYCYNGKQSSISTGDGNDSIHNISTYEDDGHYVTISSGAGNDKIKNEHGDHASIVAGSGNDSIYDNSRDSILIGGSGKDTIKLYESARTSIDAGSGNDRISLSGGYNNTIKGGTGNDSLWGGIGDETFIYGKGDGKDIIYGFENNDLLKITGTFSTSYSKSKGEVYFKVGSTSKAITLRDFDATTFHVNGSAYRISGTKLVKQ